MHWYDLYGPVLIFKDIYLMLFLVFVLQSVTTSMSFIPVLKTAPLRPMECSQTNLIVNYLSEDVTEMEIKSMFSRN